jgi:hypothetical protein
MERMDTKTDHCILKCQHKFHASCAIRSFMYNPSCPVCRGSAVESPPQRETDPAAPNTSRASLSVVVLTNDEETLVRQRRYKYRTAYLERHNTVASRNRNMHQDALRRLKSVTEESDALMEVYAHSFQNFVRQDDEATDLLRQVRNARRRVLRYKHTRDAYVCSKLGDPPAEVSNRRAVRQAIVDAISQSVDRALRFST